MISGLPLRSRIRKISKDCPTGWEPLPALPKLSDEISTSRSIASMSRDEALRSLHMSYRHLSAEAWRASGVVIARRRLRAVRVARRRVIDTAEVVLVCGSAMAATARKNYTDAVRVVEWAHIAPGHFWLFPVTPSRRTTL